MFMILIMVFNGKPTISNKRSSRSRSRRRSSSSSSSSSSSR